MSKVPKTPKAKAPKKSKEEKEIEQLLFKIDGVRKQYTSIVEQIAPILAQYPSTLAKKYQKLSEDELTERWFTINPVGIEKKRQITALEESFDSLINSLSKLGIVYRKPILYNANREEAQKQLEYEKAEAKRKRDAYLASQPAPAPAPRPEMKAVRSRGISGYLEDGLKQEVQKLGKITIKPEVLDFPLPPSGDTRPLRTRVFEYLDNADLATVTTKQIKQELNLPNTKDISKEVLELFKEYTFEPAPVPAPAPVPTPAPKAPKASKAPKAPKLQAKLDDEILKEIYQFLVDKPKCTPQKFVIEHFSDRVKMTASIKKQIREIIRTFKKDF